MGDALLSGVSGLQSYQKMLNVAGNNLANVNTTGFKSSRVTFGDLLSQTLKEASQPSGNMGGTNPTQVGSGVAVASVDRNMTQGSLENTGQPLDMAIEGAGYFVLNDGQKDVYTRVGSFAVDSQYFLVDPATGFRVQRIGAQGVAEGFQSAGSNDIRIPYDVALPAKATTALNYTGNLSADDSTPMTALLSSGINYTVGGTAASSDAKIANLDQASGLATGDTITISGVKRGGAAVAPIAFAIFNADGTSKTVGDLLTAINTAFPDSTASMSSGQLLLTDKSAGYSQTDLNLGCTSAAGHLTLPAYFTMQSAGGQSVKTTNVQIYDSQGNAHELSAAFVRTDTANKWDLVLTAITGNVSIASRRISGLTFLANGSYGGLASSGTPSFRMTFGNDPTNVRTVNVNLGSIGGFNGLSQFGGTSTASSNGQDGYASGSLSSLSVSREGVLLGVFTNGVRRDVAALQVATFQNPAGLASIGNNYFMGSANSGDPVPAQALSGGAGAIDGGTLEKSNVDVATEFVNLIVAQNGYQANARTIKVANEMLQALTNLIT